MHALDPEKSRLTAWLPWVLVAGLAGALAAQYWLKTPPAVSGEAPAVENRRPIRFRLALPEGVSIAEGRSPAIAISPQNDQIVFQGISNGGAQLYRQSIDALDAVAIAGTGGATDATFSPDGRSIAFFADGTLQRVSVDGGVAAPLAEASNPRGLHWGADDFIYLSPQNNSAITRVPGRGGKLENVTALADGQLSHRWPQLTADGKALLYTVWNDNGWDNTQIIWHPLDGSPAREIAKGGGFARHVADADGRDLLVYVHEQTLMSAPLTRASTITVGRGEPRLEHIVSNLSGGAHLAVSPSGSIVYLGGRGAPEPRDLVWLDRAGGREVAGALHATARLSELSPDDQHLAYYKIEGGTRELWVENLRTREARRLAGPEPAAAAPLLITPSGIAWTPDGTSVAFAYGDPTNLYRVPIARPESIARITTSPNAHAPASWTPDGRSLMYEELDPLSGSDLWVTTLDEQQRWTTRPFLRSPFSEVSPMLSPDGRWVAYASNESGRFETYVQPFPSGGRAIQISTNGGAFPRWSPSGRELFFVEVYGVRGIVAVPFNAGQAAPGQAIRNSRTPERAYAVSRDGKRLLLAMEQAKPASASDIVVVVNWIAELTTQGRPQ